MKKKILLSSALTIALCLSLIAGSTFALFTSSKTFSIAINSANVKLEAQIENLVTAKGYVDCVAFISDDSVSVVVSLTEGELTSTDVAKIVDIAKTETGYTADKIKVMAAN